MRGLTLQKKRLRVLTFAAELERSEVLVPRALWNFRRTLAPLLQGKEVFHGNLALLGTIKEMLPEFSWQV